MGTSNTSPADQKRGPRIALIAAMEREVAPLIRKWRWHEFARDGWRYRLFEDGNAVLMCGGIGAGVVRRAAEAVIHEVHPERVISVGFAGALSTKTKVADVIEPRFVVNAGDGSHADTGAGQVTLVSYTAIADRDQKARLAAAYSADAVDMEAAAVAQAAAAHGIKFAALKAISDAVDFSMPPTEKFVSSSGEFQSASFVLYVAVRPWLWASTIVLARNSVRASRALCAAVEDYLKRESVGLTTATPVSRGEATAGNARDRRGGLGGN